MLLDFRVSELVVSGFTVAVPVLKAVQAPGQQLSSGAVATVVVAVAGRAVKFTRSCLSCASAFYCSPEREAAYCLLPPDEPQLRSSL